MKNVCNMSLINQKHINLATKISQTSWTTHVTQTAKNPFGFQANQRLFARHTSCLVGSEATSHTDKDAEREAWPSRLRRDNRAQNTWSIFRMYSTPAGAIILFVSRSREIPRPTGPAGVTSLPQVISICLWRTLLAPSALKIRLLILHHNMLCSKQRHVETKPRCCIV